MQIKGKNNHSLRQKLNRATQNHNCIITFVIKRIYQKIQNKGGQISNNHDEVASSEDTFVFVVSSGEVYGAEAGQS